jgi:sorbitol-specific phosphotransferase system component IIBC
MATDSQQKLMIRFKFTADDLTANRDGYMSKPQQSRRQRKRRLDTLGFRFGQLVLILLLAGMVHLTVRTNGIIWLAFVGALIGLFVLWALGSLLSPASDYKADHHKRDVVTICGNVLQIPVYTSNRSSNRIQIEGIEFKISNDQSLAFEDNRPYCIYYMPDSNIVLSAEAID